MTVLMYQGQTACSNANPYWDGNWRVVNATVTLLQRASKQITGTQCTWRTLWTKTSGQSLRWVKYCNMDCRDLLSHKPQCHPAAADAQPSLYRTDTWRALRQHVLTLREYFSLQDRRGRAPGLLESPASTAPTHNRYTVTITDDLSAFVTRCCHSTQHHSVHQQVMESFMKYVTRPKYGASSCRQLSSRARWTLYRRFCYANSSTCCYRMSHVW